MIISFQQMIALLPLLIVGVTVVLVMLYIAACRRSHAINATLTIIGLNLALISLWFTIQNGPMDITNLMRVDRFSMFYTGLVLVASIATSTIAYAWLIGFPGNRNEFYLLLLLATMGGVLLTSANHFVALFLGIELLSLPLFGMVGYAFYQNRSLEASIKYTLLSAISSSFLLFGIALVYSQTGQLSFSTIGHYLSDKMLTQPVLLAGLGMMVVSFGFKLSLVPFHLWTPDVYQGAPAPVAIFLSTANKIAIFAGVIRLLLYAPVTHNNKVQLMLEIIAFVSMLFGNLMALHQSNIKRILGYSSISHMGYLLVGLIAMQANTLAIETVGVYMSGYLFATMGAFGVVSIMSSPYSGDDVDLLYYYRGMFWRNPLLSFVLTVIMLTLAGLPMTIGFIDKFYIIALCVNSHLIWLTGAVVVSSVIGLFYYLRIMISLYLSPPENIRHNNIPYNWALTAGGAVVIISSLLLLLLGIYPQPLITLVQLAHPLS